MDSLSAVRELGPDTEAAALRATGTDDGRSFAAKYLAVNPPRNPQQSRCFSQLGVAKGCDTRHIPRDLTDDGQVFMLAEVSENLREGTTACENAPRRTRTFDPLIKSQLLYQLS